MIGRLVEQEDVGLRRQHTRERCAACLAAREARGLFRTIEAELFEQIARAVRLVAARHSGFDIGERRGEAGEIRLLREITDRRAGLCEARAAIGLDKSGSDFQQRRFARAVAPDQADALAFADGNLRALEQRRAAEREMDILQGKEGRGHALSFREGAREGNLLFPSLGSGRGEERVPLLLFPEPRGHQRVERGR